MQAFDVLISCVDMRVESSGELHAVWRDLLWVAAFRSHACSGGYMFRGWAATAGLSNGRRGVPSRIVVIMAGLLHHLVTGDAACASAGAPKLFDGCKGGEEA